MHTLADYVMVVDNAIPTDLVKDLLDEYIHADNWTPYTNDKEGGGGQVIPISRGDIIGESVRRKDIEDRLTAAFTEVMGQYHKKNYDLNNGTNFLMLDRFTGFRLLKYSEGQSMYLHADRHPDIDNKSSWPVLTCTINLNDDYEGGELVLFDGEVKITPKPGNAVMYPANFMYPHEVLEVTRGTRYAIVTWAL